MNKGFCCNKWFFSHKIIYLVLALVGASLSIVLLHHHTLVNYSEFVGTSHCSINEVVNCDRVARSSYSEIFGIPIASFALCFYLAVFLIIGFNCLTKQEGSKFSALMLILSTSALIPTLIFLYLSYAVLKTVCLYCTALYLNGIVFFVISAKLQDRDRSFFANLRLGLVTIYNFAHLVVIGRGNRVESLRGYRLATAIFFGSTVLVYFIPYFLLRFPMLLGIQQRGVIQVSPINSGLSPLVFQTWDRVDISPDDLVIAGSNQVRDFSLGSDQAELIIVEFSDFECPACQKASGFLKKIYAQYPENVKLVYKNYPLDQACNSFLGRPLHQFACQAAKLARCAGMQGEVYFWRVHDALFALSDISEVDLFNIPEGIGLDLSEFNQCMMNNEVDLRIKDDIILGNRLSIQGTPSLYLVYDRTTFAIPSTIELELELKKLFTK